MVYSAYLINLGITYQRIEITNINIVLLEMMFHFFFMFTWPTLAGHAIPFSFWVLLLSISFWFNSVLICASVRWLTFLRFTLLKFSQPPFIPALRYYLFCFFFFFLPWFFQLAAAVCYSWNAIISNSKLLFMVSLETDNIYFFLAPKFCSQLILFTICSVL